MRDEPHTRQSGFSLIEMIMVIITVGIIAFAVAPIFTSGFQALFWSRDVTDTTAQAELAMERMTREIRGVDPANITTFTSSQLGFTLNGIPIVYSRNSSQNTLLRTASGSADILASRVMSLAFSYLRKDGSAAAGASQIWSIRFTLQFPGGQTIENFRTTVFLRSGDKSRQ